MKKMKHVFFVMIATFCISALMAQNGKVVITAIDPPAGSTIVSGQQTDYTFTLENQGPVTVSRSNEDTIYILLGFVQGSNITNIQIIDSYLPDAGNDLAPAGTDTKSTKLTINSGSSGTIGLAFGTYWPMQNDSIRFRVGNYNITTTGIETHKSSLNNIYASSGQLHINLYNAGTSSKLIVSNLQGQIISESEIKGLGQRTEVLDLSNQVRGIYIVNLISGDGSMESKKVFVE
jgi:hypothetical protein